ncbi:hypothetical protein FOQG_17184 [Fusarium oxysporum f. sp. raphani 54005]|uniref:Uncharacterized protein n=1 Tax=Fusarium oxysporum f. sp. raphani 54005 TaxID=1089458 RepID=X0B8P0_FUSOX|nr:hypothetical protein FOQG_17184 [Fusarium oxysporum f. sp. raphani 54005]
MYWPPSTSKLLVSIHIHAIFTNVSWSVVDLNPDKSNGPIDEKIFYPKSKPILQIATTEDELFSVVFEDSKSEFCLFFDLRLFDEPFRAGLGHISEMFVEGQMDEAVGPSDSSSAKPTHGQSNKLSCSFSAFGTERIDYRGDYQ